MADEMPEGTDTIIEGAGTGAGYDDELPLRRDEEDAPITALPSAGATSGNAAGGSASAGGAAIGGEAAAGAQSFSERMDGLRGQAGDRAREFVAGAKDRATGGLDDIVRLIEDAAAEIDGKIGNQYGDYVRRASTGVSGLSDALKGKDVDALFADAGELVRKAPGVAIGAAAAIGFVVARLARAGIGDAAANEDVKAA